MAFQGKARGPFLSWFWNALTRAESKSETVQNQAWDRETHHPVLQRASRGFWRSPRGKGGMKSCKALVAADTLAGMSGLSSGGSVGVLGLGTAQRGSRQDCEAGGSICHPRYS